MSNCFDNVNLHGKSMIIIEGHDASGKSTLAEYLSSTLELPIQESEGPPQSIEEMTERVNKYLNGPEDVIYVRHPIISERIYGPIIRPDKPNPITDDMVDRLIKRDPTFIYCDAGNRGLTDHNIKPGEDPTHLTGVQLNYANILGQYRLWAIGSAHIWYRIGDSMERVAHMLCTIDSKDQGYYS